MPHLNKFFIDETIPDYMSAEAQRRFRAKIVQTYLSYPNMFHKGKVPLHMSIILRYKTNLLAKYPRLDLIANLFIEALHGYAYDTASQIIKLDITKEKSTCEDIVVTIEKCYNGNV